MRIDVSILEKVHMLLLSFCGDNTTTDIDIKNIKGIFYTKMAYMRRF